MELTYVSGYDLSVDLKGINISYDDLGDGFGPVIFLHGFPFNKDMWKPQMEFLQNHYRVIAIDIRGFGKSKDEKSELSMDLFTDDLIAFMDHLEINSAILCGLSMGGYIALNAVGSFSDRFKGLILCDTQCTADTEEGKAKRYTAIDEIKINGPETFNNNFVKSVFSKTSLTEKTIEVEKLSKVVFENSSEIMINGLKALANRKDTCKTLDEINIPTLIICGKEDTLTPVAKSEIMHENIIDSRLVIIENAGHVTNLEQPEEFNFHVKEFLDTLVL